MWIPRDSNNRIPRRRGRVQLASNRLINSVIKYRFILSFQIQVQKGGTTIPDLVNATLTGDSVEVAAAYKSAFYVLLIQVFAAYFCYIFGKFACKIVIQGFSYAFPINLVIPLVVNFLIAACGIRNGDNCFFHGTIPDYLFFESPPGKFFTIFVCINSYICLIHRWNSWCNLDGYGQYF